MLATVSSSRTHFLAILAAAALSGGTRAADIEFNRDIRPILADNCFHCHGPDQAKRKAKLRLDTEEGARADLGERHAIVPGSPDKSELFQRLTTDDEARRMPPAKSARKLTAAQTQLIRRWIEQGAKWQPHWAFLPPRRPEPPAVKRRDWPRNAIDHFILARLERETINPVPEADPATLLRRLSLDLTGLPPTPEELDAFLQSAIRNPQSAIDQAVDRLLASPRYGERMVLDWLDAARYADSNGYQQDRTRTLWPWRDWVVDALNRNMPFDQFTVEQLAGDLLPNATVSQKVATGFNRNHMLNGEGGRIAEESRVDYVVDRVNTTATVWLGLTLGCGQCHDHKYDPFSQKEYYRLYAYFNNIAETGSVDRGGNAAPVLSLPTPEQTKRVAELQKRIGELEQELKKHPAKSVPTPADTGRAAVAGLPGLPAQLSAFLRVPAGTLAANPKRLAVQKEVADRRKALDDLNKSVLQTMVMEERPQPRESFVLVRGAYDKYGEKVQPGVIPSLAASSASFDGTRLGLARWLVSPDHPLTARVTVNRHWQTFFGTGLVKTTEDFGVQGEPPSHPELLDWLATEFVRSGWDVKALHRLIVTSATYRQSSAVTPFLRERDPDNRLLARGPRLRLSSFALRDQALTLSGLLVEKPGGPPVKPYQPPGIWEEMSFGQIKYVQDKGENLYRRSLYTFWRRAVPPTTMFDFASRQTCTVRTARTNTPLHSLLLLNDTTYVEAARILAERLMNEAGSLDERITLLFRLAASRPPRDAERAIMKQGFERARNQYTADRVAAEKLLNVGERPRDPRLDVVELAAYTGVVSVVLNLDEVMCKE